MVIAAHDDRYSHRDVVRNNRHVIDRCSIGAKNHEVFNILAWERDSFVNEVIPLDCPIWNAKADYVRLACCDSALHFFDGQSIATPVVLERFLARLRGAPAL